MLRIAGITPFSTIDWPGKLACVAFLAGCPWFCPYCQNHVLRDGGMSTMGEEELLSFLDRRWGLLDAVVFSGGEPLAQPGIGDTMARVRKRGFLVGLHSSGAYPERLREVLPHIDWLALDIKAPFASYERITGVAGSGKRVSKSLDIALASGIALETRTTWHPLLLSVADIREIATTLHDRGVTTWAVQAYRHLGTTGELPDETVYPSDVPEDLTRLFASYEFRRA